MKKHLLALSVYLRLGDRRRSLKEIEVTAFVRLPDMLHVKLAVAARINLLRRLPSIATFPEFRVIHQHIQLLLFDVELDSVAFFQ